MHNSDKATALFSGVCAMYLTYLAMEHEKMSQPTSLLNLLPTLSVYCHIELLTNCRPQSIVFMCI